MKKTLSVILALLMLLSVSAALADDGLGVLPDASVPAVGAPGSPEAPAVAAVLQAVPSASVSYVLYEIDDGRPEWQVFFTDGAFLGDCEVDAETCEVRRMRTYEAAPGALSADKAVEALQAAKGPLTVREMELDRDDGKLWYEGEAEANGVRYEFEMTVDGRIVEWERD